MQGEVGMTEHRLDEPRVKRPFIPRMVRALAIPIIFFWGFAAVTMTAFTPKVEDVAEDLAGPMVPHYAPSQRALLSIGAKFQESNSTNLTMVALEANRQLGDQDHAYYDDLMKRLQRDTKHVQYVMDLWGKPFTAAGAQSVDGKSTYVLLRLAGDTGQIVLNQTPFYGESGGQVGDTGEMRASGVKIAVTDTQKKQGDLFVHDVKVVEGTVKAGDPLLLEVDHSRRAAIRQNHSATHLLHEALRLVLGDHVAQKGSMVSADRLRFDFSHPKPVTAHELAQVE